MIELSDQIDNKINQVVEILKKYKTILVAFSGGVDSTVLLQLCTVAIGKDNVIAATGLSPTYSRWQQETASQIISLLGVRYILVKSEEFYDPHYVANNNKRCYYCKKHLLKKLQAVARHLKVEVIVEGSNLDDVCNDYRPGLQAVKELNILSPFVDAKLKKEDIRLIARKYNLPNADYPSNACLASRIPYGTKIEVSILQKIESAEDFLRNLGVKQARLRYHNNIARLEVSPEDIFLIVEPHNREKINNYIKSLGFDYVTVDLQGYRTGSFNPSKTDQ